MNTKVYLDLSNFIDCQFPFKDIHELDLLEMSDAELNELSWNEWFNWVPASKWRLNKSYQYKTREIVQKYRGW